MATVQIRNRGFQYLNHWHMLDGTVPIEAQSNRRSCNIRSVLRFKGRLNRFPMSILSARIMLEVTIQASYPATDRA